MEPPPASSSFAVGFFFFRVILVVLASGAFELASQSPAAAAPALALPRASSARRAGGDAGSAGPCDGGFAPFEPSWRGPSFAHAVDVTSVAAHRHDIGPDGRGIYVPLAITAAEPVSAGATPEGEAAAASRPVFFVLDIDSDSNLGPWLIESSVFVREWRDISATYPKARIIIGSNAAFKRRTFLLFGVAEESVVLLSGLPKLNYCIFLPHQYIVDPAVDSILLLSRWLQHVAFMRCASGLGALAYNRDAGPTPLDAELGPLQPTSVLVVPRGLKGNFVSNSRSYQGFELIQEWAASIGGSTLFVNETEDIRAQVRSVASARIIVLTEGSAFYVTASWAVGSLIVVVGRALLEQMRTVRPLAVLHELYASLNNISFVSGAEEVMPLVMDHYAQLLV